LADAIIKFSDNSFSFFLFRWQQLIGKYSHLSARLPQGITGFVDAIDEIHAGSSKSFIIPQQ